MNTINLPRELKDTILLWQDGILLDSHTQMVLKKYNKDNNTSYTLMDAQFWKIKYTKEEKDLMGNNKKFDNC